MASNERIRKYLDAGTVFGQVSRGRAEEIVRELANAGDIQRSQAQEWVDNVVERSRRSSEQILELVRHEVANQLERIDAKSLESLANQVADILRKSADAGRSATKGATTHAGKAAKDATDKAGKTAKGVTEQAGKRATQARDAATKVVPSRIPGIKTATRSAGSAGSAAGKSESKKGKSKAKKSKSQAEKAETKRTAPKKAS
jgi:polyhydroxyalkanoate synthesis regulator phasin